MSARLSQRGVSRVRTHAARGAVTLIALFMGLSGCGSNSSKDPAQSTATTPPAASVPALFGPLPTASLPASTARRLQGVLDTRVDEGSPDVIAAVITPKGVWAGAAGVGGPKGRQATTKDVFAIASINKTFTAALMMRLSEQGKVDLDAPLSTYLASPKPDSNGATVRQALQMRSGIPDTSDASRAKIQTDPAKVWTTRQVVAEFPAPTGEPGEQYEYSNPTYKMLGLAAEHVTGSSLAGAMRSQVLEPAGSPTTLLQQSGRKATPRPWALPATSDDGLPVGSYGAGGALPSMSDATFSVAAAGMAGDAPSLAAWAWQLFAGKVISARSLRAMMAADAEGNGMGLDRLAGFEPATAYGHGGSKEGYQSTLAIIPKEQKVIVVFVNQVDADTDGIATQLLTASNA